MQAYQALARSHSLPAHLCLILHPRFISVPHSLRSLSPSQLLLRLFFASEAWPIVSLTVAAFLLPLLGSFEANVGPACFFMKTFMRSAQATHNDSHTFQVVSKS